MAWRHAVHRNATSAGHGAAERSRVQAKAANEKKWASHNRRLWKHGAVARVRPSLVETRLGRSPPGCVSAPVSSLMEPLRKAVCRRPGGRFRPFGAARSQELSSSDRRSVTGNAVHRPISTSASGEGRIRCASARVGSPRSEIELLPWAARATASPGRRPFPCGQHVAHSGGRGIRPRDRRPPRPRPDAHAFVGVVGRPMRGRRPLR